METGSKIPSVADFNAGIRAAPRLRQNQRQGVRIQPQSCVCRLTFFLFYFAVEFQGALRFNACRKQAGKVIQRQVTQLDLAVACRGCQFDVQAQSCAGAVPAGRICSKPVLAKLATERFIQCPGCKVCMAEICLLSVKVPGLVCPVTLSR